MKKAIYPMHILSLNGSSNVLENAQSTDLIDLIDEVQKDWIYSIGRKCRK